MALKLKDVSREELIALVESQAEQILILQTALKRLQTDYDALRIKFEKNQKPPTDSGNSSQPPSRDWKRNMVNRPKQKHGAPQGHPKYERYFVEQPDHIVDLHVEQCTHCEQDLSSEEGRLLAVNQITEIPSAKAEIIEVRQYAVDCPECGQIELGKAPVGLEMERTFGARLESTVVYYRQEQHISYARTERAMLDLHGVTISQGGIDLIMQRLGQKAQLAVQLLKVEVRQAKVVSSDETSARVDGQTLWQWVFYTANAVLHVIQPSRGADVILRVLGDHKPEVWGSDCFSAQLKAPSEQKQICLAHQDRNLEAVAGLYPLSFWISAMRALFRYAIHLSHQRDNLPPDQFRSQVQRIENICDRLLKRALTKPEEVRLKNRYLKLRQALFVFLYRRDVLPTNNLCEQALRSAVIHRKVSGGFRSRWGADAYAVYISVVQTAKLRGYSPFTAIQNLFGPSALPLPFTGE